MAGPSALPTKPMSLPDDWISHPGLKRRLGQCSRTFQKFRLGLYPMAVIPSPVYAHSMTQRKPKLVKTSITKFAETPRTPVSPKRTYRRRLNVQAATSNRWFQKHDDDLPQPRTTREDRGSRLMETTLSSQMLFRFCGHLSP